MSQNLINGFVIHQQLFVIKYGKIKHFYLIKDNRNLFSNKVPLHVGSFQVHYYTQHILYEAYMSHLLKQMAFDCYSPSCHRGLFPSVDSTFGRTRSDLGPDYPARARIQARH